MNNSTDHCLEFLRSIAIFILVIKIICWVITTVTSLFAIVMIRKNFRSSFLSQRLYMYFLSVGVLQGLCQILGQFPVEVTEDGQVALKSGLGWHTVCILFAYLDIVTTWIINFLMIWILLLMLWYYYRVVHRGCSMQAVNRTSHVREGIGVLMSTISALLISCIPFIKDMYGVFGAYCWIRTIDDDYLDSDLQKFSLSFMMITFSPQFCCLILGPLSGIYIYIRHGPDMFNTNVIKLSSVRMVFLLATVYSFLSLLPWVNWVYASYYTNCKNKAFYNAILLSMQTVTVAFSLWVTSFYICLSMSHGCNPPFIPVGSPTRIRTPDSSEVSSGMHMHSNTENKEVTDKSESTFGACKSECSKSMVATHGYGNLPFIYYEQIMCDCNGQKCIIDEHDITLDIIIPKGNSKAVKIEIGVIMDGPFIFEENTQIVSPVFWFHFPYEAIESDQKQLLFHIKLPHCLVGLTIEKLIYHQIHFVKADLEGENEHYYKFNQYNTETDFVTMDKYGALKTASDGLFCITMLRKSDTTDIVRYCLAQVDIPPSPPMYEFDFYALLDLATHKRALDYKLQEQKHVKVNCYSPFKFLNHLTPLQLNASGDNHCIVKPVSGEIRISDIDFRGITDSSENFVYPTRMKIRIKNTNSQQFYFIKFNGCTNNLEFNLKLSSDADLFEEAMQNGYVVLQSTVLLFIGVAGAGKTSFCHLIFDEPPPLVRESTPLAKSSIRAISLTRAIISDQEVIIWKRVSQQEFKSLVADAIKGMRGLESNYQQFQSRAKKHQYKTTTLVNIFKNMNFRGLWNILEIIKNPSLIHEIQNDEHNSQPLLSENYGTNQTESQNDIMRHDEAPEESDPLATEIARLFELEPVKQILDLINASKGSVELFRQKWLYVIDSGGQPQFHELLPTFIHHISAAAFFVKLNEEFNDYPTIEYYGEGGILCGEPYKSSYSHLETLQNCLQAVQSRHNINSISNCPELFFIGTHRDLENSNEPVGSKNKKLISMLQQHEIFKDHLNYCSIGKSDQLLYTVNAKAPEIDDKNVAANFRQKVMSRCHPEEHKIPIRWFVLELLLQYLAKDGVISFKECVEVAGRLGMNEVKLKAAIDYLVKLNIFEYFPHILPSVVFTTSQVLLNKITELVEHSHNLRSGSFLHGDSVDIQFRAYGIVTLKMLKRSQFSSHYVKGLFEDMDLLYLWEKLLVVARGPNGNRVMPAVLDGLSSEKLSQHRSDNTTPIKILSIAVHYSGNLFPAGIFSCLIAHLQNQSTWKISMNDNQPECLYKNCVAFNVSGRLVDANVTLIYSHDWIELHVIDTFEEDEQSTCNLLRNDLFNGLKHVQQIQKYDNLVPEIAFFCTVCEGESYHHLASVTSTKKLQCRKLTRKREKLTEKHLLWLDSYDEMVTHFFPQTENSPSSSSSIPKEAVAPSNPNSSKSSTGTQQSSKGHVAGIQSIPQIYTSENQTPLNQHNHSVLFKQLQIHSAKWREIALCLGFLPAELDNIEAKPFLLSGAPTSWLSAMLAEWLQWAPGDSRGSKKFAMLEDLKIALSESGLTRLAHDLGI